MLGDVQTFTGDLVLCDDKVTAAVKADHTIKQYGMMLLSKLGEKRVVDISARMRELARMLIVLCQTDATDSKASLDSYLTGKHFDDVLAAIEAEAKPQAGPGGRRIFEKPAFVIKLGSSLLKCAQMKRGEALHQGDSVGLKEAEDFLTLHNNEYTDKMASTAHASYRIKGNTLTEFPDEDDLRLLRDYQQQKISSLVDSLKMDPDEFVWRELAEITMTRIIVFNARRGSEAADLTVQDFMRASNTVDPFLVATLSKVEQQLLKRLTVVEVIGKRNRPVPILQTEDMTKAVNTLQDSRGKCNVDSRNQFLVVLSKTKQSHLSFSVTLHRIARQAGLKKTHLLTTTKMRKHLATMAQVVQFVYNNSCYVMCIAAKYLVQFIVICLFLVKMGCKVKNAM